MDGARGDMSADADPAPARAALSRRFKALLGLYGRTLDPISVKAGAAMVLAILTAAIAVAAAPLWLKAAIDILAAPARDMGAVLALIMAYGLTLLIGRGLGEARWLAFASIDQRLDRRLTSSLFERLLRARPGERSAHDAQTLTQGLEGSRLLVQQVLLVLAPAVLELIAVLVFLCATTPVFIVGAFLCAAGGLALACQHGAPGAFDSAVRAYERRAESFQAIEDGLANGETARLFGAETALRRRLDRRLARAHRAWRSYFRRRASASVLIHVGAASCIVLALGAGVVGIGSGRLGVGDFVLLQIYVFQALAPIETLALGFREALQYAASAARLADIAGEPRADDKAMIAPGRVQISGAPDVVAEQLCFRSQTGRALLADISFTIPAGAFVGLVGRSGSGKSTLARLMVGLDAPTSGRVAIGGRSPHDTEAAQARRFALAAQTPSVLADTLAFNIALGEDAIDDRRLARAARAAMLEEVVAAHPRGLGRRLGPAGAGLSGGERQRLALARILAHEPSLIILDEATSGLDRAMEARALTVLRAAPARQALRARTLIMITHRLEALDSADLILVLDNGRLIESGAPAELLACDGFYARLRAMRRSSH